MPRLFFCFSILAFVLLIGCGRRSKEIDFESPYEIIDEIENLREISVAPQASSNDMQRLPAVSIPPLDPSQNPINADFTEKDIQQALKNRGLYNGKIDGKIGPMTKAAIKNFQKDNGLKVDGVVGAKTWEKLSVFQNQESGSKKER